MTRLRLAVLALLVIGLALALVATHGFGLWAHHDTGILTLNGNVDIRQVDLGFRVSGRIDMIAVEEGARVRAGVTLAVLDLQPLKDQLASADAQVDAARAQLAKLKNGNRSQDIAQAAARLADLRAQVGKAKADLDRRAGLVKTGAISGADFLATQTQYDSTLAQVRSAEQSFSLQQVGARQEDVAAAQAQESQAIAERSRIQTDLADAQLRAPNEGVILTRAREPGAIVQPGETVLTLTIDRPMRIRAYVDEADLPRLSPGMPVEVHVDGVTKTYQGSIGYISPTAEFTPKSVETRELRTDLVYRLRVLVGDPDDALRQGQPVTVSIPGARAKQDR